MGQVFVTWRKISSIIKYLDILLKLPQLNDSAESSFQWEGCIFPRVGSRFERQSASKGNRKESDVSSLHVKGIEFILCLWNIALFLRANAYSMGN